MKKFTQMNSYVFIMLFAVQLSFSQAEFQLDSIQKFDWDTNTTTFEMNSREHFTYDNGGTKETSYIWYLPNGSIWNPALRYFKTYDGNNNIIEKLNETYNPALAIWNASTKDFYTYDSFENIILSEDFTSSDDGVTWDMPRSEIEMNYNTDNLETKFTRRNYNATTMTMIDLVQETTTYNGLLKADEITKTWSSSDSKWIFNIKIEYSYTDDLPIQKDYFSWLGSDWDTQPYLKIAYTYDGDLLTEEIGQKWNSSGSIWENDFRTTRTYNDNGNIQEVLVDTWDDNTSAWLNDRQELWYWTEAGEVLDLDEEVIDYGYVRIFPNPASSSFTIAGLNFGEYGYVTVTVTHASSGQAVREIEITANMFPDGRILSVDTSRLPSGLYILGINTSNFNITRKVIIDN